MSSRASLSKRLALARRAFTLVHDAQEAWAEYLRASGLPREPEENLIAFTAIAEDATEKLAKEAEERRRRFDAVPVLQALLRFKDGSTRRVAVSKPTDEIDEPYIGEMFYAALARRGVVASLESYPVLVVDKHKRVSGEIAVAST